MRQWLRNAFSCRIAAFFGAMALLIVSAALMSTAPIHKVWANGGCDEGDCDSYFDTDNDEETDELYDAQLEEDRQFTCQYPPLEVADGGSTSSRYGGQDPRKVCNDLTVDAMLEGNPSVRLAHFRKNMRNGQGAMPVRYFVKKEPHAVMACAIQFDSTQAASAGDPIKQNAVYHPAENMLLKLTPAAFFNRMVPPSESPGRGGLRILAGGGGDDDDDICNENKNNGICTPTNKRGEARTSDAYAMLDWTASGLAIGNETSQTTASLDMPDYKGYANLIDPQALTEAGIIDAGIILTQTTTGGKKTIKKDPRTKKPKPVGKNQTKKQKEPNSNSKCQKKAWEGGGCSGGGGG